MQFRYRKKRNNMFSRLSMESSLESSYVESNYRLESSLVASFVLILVP